MATAQPTMMVKVYSAFTTYLKEECFSITAVNHTGQFDVLPFHKNFITVLEPCEIVAATRKEPWKMAINQGVMYVHDNSVTVFLDI